MRFLLPAVIAAFGVVYIFFIPPEPVGLKIFMKLIPMVLIIGYAALRPRGMSASYKPIVMAGLFICAVADGVIYWFIAGLVTFLIAHLFYITAFRKASVRPMPWSAGAALLVFGIVMAAVVALPLLLDGNLLGAAVIAYMIVILMMGWTAVRTANPYAIAGALLFILSDSILAIDRFTVPIPGRDAFVMVPYYAAQFLIASSIGFSPGQKTDPRLT